MRRALVATLLLVVACTSSGAPTGPERPATASPGASPEPPPVTSVELRAPGDGSFLVRGRYREVPSECVDPGRPILDGRYPGTLRLALAPDGTFSLTATIRFREYLEGIAEVPASWPTEALRAQAIAARSYALATTGWSGQEGDELAEPICSTSACQVYAGMPLDPSPLDRRWVQAVRDTDGRVLLFEGRPAETLYFSTSDGRTYGNDEVFGSAPLPYLRPVVELDDDASSLSRWTSRIRLGDLATFLRRAGEWGQEPIETVRRDGDDVVVSGGVESRSMSAGAFRDAVNGWAHCLDPGRYPGGLPTTIPSRWFSLTAGGAGVLTVIGRGWGHGVGMVQWGAYGKARRGLSAEAILAFYYGGLRPEPYPQPGLIHVEIADGLRSLRLEPSGPGARLDGERVRGTVIVFGGDGLRVRGG